MEHGGYSIEIFRIIGFFFNDGSKGDDFIHRKIQFFAANIVFFHEFGIKGAEQFINDYDFRDIGHGDFPGFFIGFRGIIHRVKLVGVGEQIPFQTIDALFVKFHFFQHFYEFVFERIGIDHIYIIFPFSDPFLNELIDDIVHRHTFRDTDIYDGTLGK